MQSLFNIPYALMVLCSNIRVYLTFSPPQHQKKKQFLGFNNPLIQNHLFTFFLVVKSVFSMHVVSYFQQKDFKDLPKLFIMTLFGMKRRDLHRIYCKP